MNLLKHPHIDLHHWVMAEQDPRRRLARQGMHAVIVATDKIGGEFPPMIMKGGVLMAVRYQSQRFTTDIDYSTTVRLDEIDVNNFIVNLDRNLQDTAENLGHDLMCAVQGHKVNPPRKDVTFPTLQVSVAVARASNAKEMKKLRLKTAANTVSVDYSFNKCAAQTELLDVSEAAGVRAYDLTDLIAEKYRSLLQQTVRHRARYQDVYDLHFLLTTCGVLDSDTCSEILRKLLQSIEGKLSEPRGQELRDPAVIKKSRERYAELDSQVDSPPPFDTAYSFITTFYEQLSWNRVAQR